MLSVSISAVNTRLPDSYPTLFSCMLQIWFQWLLVNEQYKSGGNMHAGIRLCCCWIYRHNFFPAVVFRQFLAFSSFSECWKG